MALFHGCMKSKAWQPPVVEVDVRLGQGAVPDGVSGRGIVVPSAGASDAPNIRAIMYHPWCTKT